jgi:hypothetical protein
MTSPHIPDDTDAMLVLLDAMTNGGNPSRAIEAQERRAQTELLNSTVIPSEVLHSSEEDLTALGFKLGDVVEGDKLFRHAELPEGWKREGSEHAMWSYIVDDKGRRRCSVFFKGAWYDRSAHISVSTVAGYVLACVHENAPVVLDDEWATRDAVLAALTEIRNGEVRNVDLWANHSQDYAREYEQEARARVAKVDALVAELTAQAESEGTR